MLGLGHVGVAPIATSYWMRQSSVVVIHGTTAAKVHATMNCVRDKDGPERSVAGWLIAAQPRLLGRRAGRWSKRR
jgi:hypothetical protein